MAEESLSKNVEKTDIAILIEMISGMSTKKHMANLKDKLYAAYVRLRMR